MSTRDRIIFTIVLFVAFIAFLVFFASNANAADLQGEYDEPTGTVGLEVQWGMQTQDGFKTNMKVWADPEREVLLWKQSVWGGEFLPMTVGPSGWDVNLPADNNSHTVVDGVGVGAERREPWVTMFWEPSECPTGVFVGVVRQDLEVVVEIRNTSGQDLYYVASDYLPGEGSDWRKLEDGQGAYLNEDTAGHMFLDHSKDWRPYRCMEVDWNFRRPVVYSVSPKIAVPGDTVTVIGKNLLPYWDPLGYQREVIFFHDGGAPTVASPETAEYWWTDQIRFTIGDQHVGRGGKLYVSAARWTSYGLDFFVFRGEPKKVYVPLVVD